MKALKNDHNWYINFQKKQSCDFGFTIKHFLIFLEIVSPARQDISWKQEYNPSRNADLPAYTSCISIVNPHSGLANRHCNTLFSQQLDFLFSVPLDCNIVNVPVSWMGLSGYFGLLCSMSVHFASQYIYFNLNSLLSKSIC
jgi:hypothetical protein